MPILTPTYPHQNSAFNVSANTLKTIRGKMAAAKRLAEEILEQEERHCGDIIGLSRGVTQNNRSVTETDMLATGRHKF